MLVCMLYTYVVLDLDVSVVLDLLVCWKFADGLKLSRRRKLVE